MPASVMMLLLGSAAAQDLTQPCPQVDLDVAADDAVRALTDDELTFARDVVTTALEGVGCVPRVVDPEDLATLYQARAAASFYADPQLGYASDLAAAAAVYPGWFNDRLGPDLRRAWEGAAAGISGTATLSVWPIPDDGVLYVDGHAHEDQPVEVLPGRHLVQVAVGAEVAWVWTGDLATDDAQVLESGLPEPSKARVLRDNPLLWGGLIAGIGTGAGTFGTYSYGHARFDQARVESSGTTFYDDEPDPLAALEQDWRSYRVMRGGLVVGTAAASALLTTHMVLKLRARKAP
jgi:hypothetical protein